MHGNVNLEELFAVVIAQHAHQRIIHFDKVAFRRGEVDAFLHVVKQLTVAALGFTAVGNVLDDMDSLHAFIQRSMHLRGRDQIVALQ